MFEAHVLAAAVATRVELGRQGIMVTREQAAAIFRDAAEMWSRDYDTAAERNSYELMVEM